MHHDGDLKPGNVQKSKMKIAFLLIGVDAPSAHYRVLQYLPFLEKEGCTTNVYSIPERFGDRLKLFREIKNYDIVFLQKKLLPPFMGQILRNNSGMLIFDFDDAIYTRPGGPWSYMTALRVKRRLNILLRKASIVTTANEYLADYARQYSSSVAVIPMAIDVDLWQPAEHANVQKVTIGWAGSPGNLLNLERLEPVLSAMLQKYPFLKLAIFSGKKPTLACPFEYHPFKPGTEPAFIQSLDIGLLPLREEEYSRGKSPIKAIQYLSCGVPVVGNVIGATAEILNQSNSISVSSDKEWIQAIEKLVIDHDLRNSMGQAGRQLILKNHNIYRIREQLLALFIKNSDDRKQPLSKNGS